MSVLLCLSVYFNCLCLFHWEREHTEKNNLSGLVWSASITCIHISIPRVCTQTQTLQHKNIILHCIYYTTKILYNTMKAALFLFVSQVTANALLVRRTRECCQHPMDRRLLRVLNPQLVSGLSTDVHFCRQTQCFGSFLFKEMQLSANKWEDLYVLSWWKTILSQ